jgi:hypothetical protein
MVVSQTRGRGRECIDWLLVSGSDAERALNEARLPNDVAYTFPEQLKGDRIAEQHHRINPLVDVDFSKCEPRRTRESVWFPFN